MVISFIFISILAVKVFKMVIFYYFSPHHMETQQEKNTSPKNKKDK